MNQGLIAVGPLAFQEVLVSRQFTASRNFCRLGGSEAVERTWSASLETNVIAMATDSPSSAERMRTHRHDSTPWK